MIFSNPQGTKGQTSVEAIMALAFLITVSITGTALLLHRAGTLVLVKWAAFQSRCIAIGHEPKDCEKVIRRQLQDWFAFRDIKIKNTFRRHIIHTEISATLLVPLFARYDMGPSEYRRVMK
jgi:hypothetical protein